MLCWISWPVLKAVVPMPKALARDKFFGIRKRALQLGDYFVTVCVTLWMASGIVLPMWLSTASVLYQEEFSMRPVALFLLSQLLFGVTASTLTYFIVSFLVIRYFYPRLLARDLAEPQEAVQLVKISQRMWIYTLLAFSVPFGALLVYTNFNDGANRNLAPALAIVGFLGFLLCLFLDRTLREDLAAMVQVINPSGSTLGGTEKTSDSFMTGSRR